MGCVAKPHTKNETRTWKQEKDQGQRTSKTAREDEQYRKQENIRKSIMKQQRDGSMRDGEGGDDGDVVDGDR